MVGNENRSCNWSAFLALLLNELAGRDETGYRGARCGFAL
jgi:hypothetical protein